MRRSAASSREPPAYVAGQSDLATGLLPTCPVCSGRDHEVAVGAVLG